VPFVRISSCLWPEIEVGLTSPPRSVRCQAFEAPHPDTVRASADEKLSHWVDCEATDSAPVSADSKSQPVNLHVVYVKWAFVARANNGRAVAGNQILLAGSRPVRLLSRKGIGSHPGVGSSQTYTAE
jgi:hypothetical protein